MAAEDNLHPVQFYHGTSSDISKSVRNRSGGKNYFTPSLYQAHKWARRNAQNMDRPMSAARVYPVEPVGKYGEDPRSLEGYRSVSPLKVTGPAIPSPDTQGMRDMSNKYRTPAVEHDPNKFIGRDKDYRRDADEWERRWYGD